MYRGTARLRRVTCVHDAADAAGETPVAPVGRMWSLVSSPVQVATGAESRGDEGPMRLIRHERVSEDGHQRGR